LYPNTKEGGTTNAALKLIKCCCEISGSHGSKYEDSFLG
jgi:hypothetical protein